MNCIFLRRGYGSSGSGGGGGGASEYAVTIAGTLDEEMAGVARLDTEEILGIGTHTMLAGTQLIIWAGAKHPNYFTNAKITYNGTTVAQGSSSTGGAEYEIAITANTTITLTAQSLYTTIAITTS